MKVIVLVFVSFLLFITELCTHADVVANNSHSIKYYGIGVLNMPKNFKVYKQPYKDSDIIREVTSDNIKKKSAIVDNRYVQKISYIAYVPSENVALLTVESDNDNGWYNVYLNQNTGETGWVYDNNESFYTYKSLFYSYGKRFGIKLFNDLPENKKILYAKQSEESQKLEQLTFPRYMTFTVITGNWLLATVSDMSTQAKVGWYKWRNDDGTLNVFPNFKDSL